MNLRRFSLVWASLAILLGGCNDTTNVNALVDPPASICPRIPTPRPKIIIYVSEPTIGIDVATCAAGMSQVDIDTNVAIASQILESARELGRGTLRARRFAYDLVYQFSHLGCGDRIYPYGFPMVRAYAGSGAYHDDNDEFRVQTMLASDTSFGKAGDNLSLNLFDPNTYAKSIVVQADLQLDPSWLEHARQGPHVLGSLTVYMVEPRPEPLELWGIPPVPAFTAQHQELAKVLGENVAMRIESEMQTKSGMNVRIATDAFSVGDIYNAKLEQLPVTAFTATNDETGQTTSLVSWDLSFPSWYESFEVGGGFTIRVDGGTFPFYAKFVDNHRATMDLHVTCDPPTP